MASSEHKRQKALAKKRKRSKVIRKERNKANNVSLSDYVRQLGQGAWQRCSELSEGGIASITCVRRHSTEIGACIFLVDELCLGVKDVVVVRDVDLDAIREKGRARGDSEVDPAYAYKKILESIAWARNFGFEPHPLTTAALQVFEGVDPNTCTDSFSFGHPKDGKPFYMQGPYDSPLRMKQILENLRELGPGNYHVLFADLGTSKIAPSHLGEWAGDETQFDESDEDDDEGFDDDIEDDFGDTLDANTVDGEVIPNSPSER